MAKEQWHNWGRTLIILAGIIVTGAGIVFTSGGYIEVIKGNTKDIDVLEIDVDEVKEDVHKLELQDKDLANIAERTLNYMVKADARLEAIQKEQSEQKTIQAVNSEKLKTLTKD